MFYDERIELEKGKVCQAAMVLAVAFSLPYWVLRILYVWPHATLHNPAPIVALDGLITVTGLVLLTIGLCRNRGCDEREQFERYHYYSRMMPVYLSIIGVGSAILLPMQQHLALFDQFSYYSVTDILEPLAFTTGVYVFYQFKKREIYLNYSFIEDTHYYRRVWKNLGKFALWILMGLSISLGTLALLPTLQPVLPLSNLSAVSRSKTAGILLAQYASVLLGGSGIYLFLSLMERESYQKLCGLSKSMGLCLVAVIVLYGLNFLWSQYNLQLFTDLNKLYQLYKITQYMPNLALYRSFALIMCLTYFSYEYQRHQPDKAIAFGCKCILLTTSLSMVLLQYHYFLVGIFAQTLYRLPNFLTWYSYLLVLRTLLRDLLYLVGGSCILLSLVRHQALSRWHLAGIPIAVVALVIRTVLWMHTGGSGITANYTYITTAALLVYLCFLAFHVIKKINTEKAE